MKIDEISIPAFYVAKANNGFLMRDETGVYVFSSFQDLMNALGGLYGDLTINERVAIIRGPDLNETELEKA